MGTETAQVRSFAFKRFEARRRGRADMNAALSIGHAALQQRVDDHVATLRIQFEIVVNLRA